MGVYLRSEGLFRCSRCHHTLWFSECGPGLGALGSSKKLLEMQTRRPHPISVALESPGLRSRNPCCEEPSKRFLSSQELSSAMGGMHGHLEGGMRVGALLSVCRTVKPRGTVEQIDTCCPLLQSSGGATKGAGREPGHRKVTGGSSGVARWSQMQTLLSMNMFSSMHHCSGPWT